MLCEVGEKPRISHTLDLRNPQERSSPSIEQITSVWTQTGNYDVIETSGWNCPALQNILRIGRSRIECDTIYKCPSADVIITQQSLNTEE